MNVRATDHYVRIGVRSGLVRSYDVEETNLLDRQSLLLLQNFATNFLEYYDRTDDFIFGSK